MITKMIVLDWRVIKPSRITFLLLPAFACLVGWSNTLLIVPTCVLMCLGFSISPFLYEEKGAVNNLYLTLPVKRNSIIAGRYALSLIFLLCGIIIGAAITPLAHLYTMSKWFIGFNGRIVVISISFLLYALFNLFMFPMLFKLGYQKGKFWGFYLPLVFIAFLFGIYSYISAMPRYATLTIEFVSYALENMLLVSGGIIVVATILILLSYIASTKLYSKRDF